MRNTIFQQTEDSIIAAVHMLGKVAISAIIIARAASGSFVPLLQPPLGGNTLHGSFASISMTELSVRFVLGLPQCAILLFGQLLRLQLFARREGRLIAISAITIIVVDAVIGNVLRAVDVLITIDRVRP